MRRPSRHRHTLGLLACMAVSVASLTGCPGRRPTAPRTHTVSGTVLRSSGAPASSVNVALDHPLTADLSEVLFATTDAGGAFRFSGLDEGDYRLSAFSADTLVAAVAFRLDGGSGANVVLAPITLRRAGVFRGRVLRPGATDHSGVLVTADELVSLATTDSTGAYSLTGIPVGTWAVTAMTLLGQSTAHGHGTLAAPGDTVTLPDLVLAPVPIPVALHAVRTTRARGLGVAAQAGGRASGSR